LSAFSHIHTTCRQSDVRRFSFFLKRSEASSKALNISVLSGSPENCPSVLPVGSRMGSLFFFLKRSKVSSKALNISLMFGSSDICPSVLPVGSRMGGVSLFYEAQRSK